MLFLFGLRSSILKKRKLNHTKCSHCQVENSFTVTTLGKYFHFFWVPIFPISKTSTAECSHCKKTYYDHEFSQDMRTSLFKENQLNPAKHPIWHRIGCLLLIIPVLLFVGLFIFSLIYHTNNKTATPSKDIDNRKILLNKDFDTLTESKVFESDSTTILFRSCITYYLNEEIDRNKIKYLIKQNKNRLLVLMEVRDIKKIKARSRKQLITLVEDCLDEIGIIGIDEYFIGVEGKYNTVLTKTPFDEDLGGRFADKYKLLDFYDSQVILDTINNKPINSSTILNDSTITTN